MKISKTPKIALLEYYSEKTVYVWFRIPSEKMNTDVELIKMPSTGEILASLTKDSQSLANWKDKGAHIVTGVLLKWDDFLILSSEYTAKLNCSKKFIEKLEKIVVGSDETLENYNLLKWIIDKIDKEDIKKLDEGSYEWTYLFYKKYEDLLKNFIKGVIFTDKKWGDALICYKPDLLKPLSIWSPYKDPSEKVSRNNRALFEDEFYEMTPSVLLNNLILLSKKPIGEKGFEKLDNLLKNKWLYNLKGEKTSLLTISQLKELYKNSSNFKIIEYIEALPSQTFTWKDFSKTDWIDILANTPLIPQLFQTNRISFNEWSEEDIVFCLNKSYWTNSLLNEWGGRIKKLSPESLEELSKNARVYPIIKGRLENYQKIDSLITKLFQLIISDKSKDETLSELKVLLKPWIVSEDTGVLTKDNWIKLVKSSENPYIAKFFIDNNLVSKLVYNDADLAQLLNANIGNYLIDWLPFNEYLSKWNIEQKVSLLYKLQKPVQFVKKWGELFDLDNLDSELAYKILIYSPNANYFWNNWFKKLKFKKDKIDYLKRAAKDLNFRENL